MALHYQKTSSIFLNDGWLVHLEVNANTLSAKDGYEGHSVLIVGYGDAGATIHNPDGVGGNKPNHIFRGGCSTRLGESSADRIRCMRSRNSIELLVQAKPF
jgi:hypothetical protein